MKILYIVMKYNMGRPEQGMSYEHYNFYDTLVRMDRSKHEVIYFPFDEIMLKFGRDAMNDMLIKKVETEKPDLCFFELITHQIKPETIKWITESGRTITFNWFTDDEWRFDMFSRYYAPLFDFVSTTDSKAMDKYDKIGYKNVIKTEWACNNFIYGQKHSIGKEKFEHEVSFIGKAYGNRPALVNAISDAGIKIECWGSGWPGGRISQKEMIKVFRRSRINLNFSKTQSNRNLTYLMGIFLNRDITNDVRINYPREWLPQARHFMSSQPNQIKGRAFEIPGSGGFLLTENADKLENYYADGKEIAVFNDEKDLVEEIEYYLNNEKKRSLIAKAGFKRTMKDHTYERRFNEIFKYVGL